MLLGVIVAYRCMPMFGSIEWGCCYGHGWEGGDECGEGIGDDRDLY